MRGIGVWLVTAALAVLIASPAAANTSQANTENFSRSRTIVNTALQTCVDYTITGELKYTAKRYGPTAIDRNVEWRLEDIRIVTPTLSAQTYRYDPGNHACTTNAQRVDDIEFSERWAGYGCNWNPSISISAPFGVGVSFWPDCDDKKAGIFTGHRATAGTGFSKGWDDGRVEYPNQGLGLKPQGVGPDEPNCYGVVARFDITIGGSGRAFRSPVRHKVCPTPQW